MKRIKLLLLSILFLGTLSMAMSAKVKEPKLVEGTTVGKYQKPGAPVDMRYTSQHVEVGQKSEVHIVLMTLGSSGVMTVKLNVDKNLQQQDTVNKKQSFKLTEGQKEYPLDLVVSADNDGLYYVRVLVSIKGKGMRAFAVPVYVGEGKLKTNKTPVQKTSTGENISVSPAVETIIKR